MRSAKQGNHLKEGWEVQRKRSMRLMTNNPSELNFDIPFPSTTPPTTHPPPQKLPIPQAMG